MALDALIPPRSFSRPTLAVVVIGAGMGGLAAALGLASQGVDVTLVERAAQVGGKLREIEVGGAAIDAGPTVLTLPEIFQALFAEAGACFEDRVRLRPLDVLARHAWVAGDRFDLHADVEQTADAVAAMFGPAEARAYRAFCAEARRIYRMLDAPFMRAASPSMLRLVASLGLSGDLFAISPFTTLWRALSSRFGDPRLRQLFARYATYCGSSPFACPATLMLVAHVEQAGVWSVEGGMHRLAEAFAALARERGVAIRLGTEVRAIRTVRGRAAAVELASGERLDADAVVCNADAAALVGGLFGPDVRRAAMPVGPGRRSLSAVTFATSGKASGFPLDRHSVFFSDDYPAEFADLFDRRRLPRDPTVYVCAQDRGPGAPPSSSRAPERLFMIVNAPADGDVAAYGEAEVDSCAQRMVRTLERCGLTVEPQAPFATATPRDFSRMFPGTGGALYGAASHGWRASFRRSGVRSRIPGLYLCGGSVHPGPGLPMAALSGRLAAASLVEDWVSTHRSVRVAMPGGMSTA